ncbi:MAG: hypothetical protein UT26_C0018G0006 [Microgenomates group bacterium GW2011_GWC1_39_12]|nr:MAG: hypothetical protein UT26_C0018G0006 [Microgenomates group bacterium GW2011_GWC1_39_12]
MNIEKIFALDSTNIVGTITNPLNKYGGVEGGGLTAFFSNILRLIFVVAGMYALVNIIIAGFEYMTAGGDAKKLTKAWERIWQTLLGLAIIAGSFVLAAIFGYILFGNPMYMLNPVIYGPN